MHALGKKVEDHSSSVRVRRPAVKKELSMSTGFFMPLSLESEIMRLRAFLFAEECFYICDDRILVLAMIHRHLRYLS